METKILARIAAGAFVVAALTMTVLTQREERANPQPDAITVPVPDGDPLPDQLRACAAMGEQALASPDCRAAWAENRRRFLMGEEDGLSQARRTVTPNLTQAPAQDQ